MPLICVTYYVKTDVPIIFVKNSFFTCILFPKERVTSISIIQNRKCMWLLQSSHGVKVIYLKRLDSLFFCEFFKNKIKIKEQINLITYNKV